MFKELVKSNEGFFFAKTFEWSYSLFCSIFVKFFFCNFRLEELELWWLTLLLLPANISIDFDFFFLITNYPGIYG